MSKVKKIIANLIVLCLILMTFTSPAYAAVKNTPHLPGKGFVHIGSGYTADGIAYDVYEVPAKDNNSGITPYYQIQEYKRLLFIFENETMPPTHLPYGYWIGGIYMSGVLYIEGGTLYTNYELNYCQAYYSGYCYGTL